MTVELKPCPFCGGEAVSILNRSDDHERCGEVLCQSCEAGTKGKTLHWSDNTDAELSSQFQAELSWNTRATPAPAELVRYSAIELVRSIDAGYNPTPSDEGDYVEYDQATAMIAARDGEIVGLKQDVEAWKQNCEGWKSAAQAAQAELDQIKAQLKDPNAVHIALLRGDIAKPSIAQINHVYAAPVASVPCSVEVKKLDLTPAMKTLFTEIVGDVTTFRDMEPEEDEIWESWYYAAFDMIIPRIRETFDRNKTEISELIKADFDRRILSQIVTKPAASEAETIERLREALKAMPDDAGDAAYQFCRFYIGSEHEDAISSAVSSRVQRAVDAALKGASDV